jgi:hypothetical protein
MRLTETEKKQLVDATYKAATDAAIVPISGLKLQVAMPLPDYFKHVEEFASLLSRPKPIAFEGHAWKL